MDGGSPSQSVIVHDTLIVGSSERYLYALNKNTGKGLYRYDSGYDSGFSGAPLYDPEKNRLYFLTSGGNLMSFSVGK